MGPDASAERASTSVGSSASASRVKRSSVVAPKAPTSLDSRALVANHAILTGTQPITIGPQTVIHPHAKIVSAYSAVEIGSGCVLAEKAVLGLSDASQDAARACLALPDKIIIGNNVTIESGSLVEAAEIGDNSIIDVDSIIGAGAVIGKNCTISARQTILPGERVPDFTVVYGHCQRRTNRSLQSTQVISEIKAKSHDQHLKMLHSLVSSNLAKFQ